MTRRLLPIALLTAACSGGSPAGPSAQPTPEPPVTRHAVTGVVYYDENANGRLDDDDGVRLAGVTVTIGDRSATSGADGRFEIGDAPSGARTATVGTASLPPYFEAGAAATLTVPPPPGFELGVPVVLPIGTNQPHVYMAFGDSITSGDGSRGGRGYRAPLAGLLRSHWGKAEVLNEGEAATKSDAGAARLPGTLAADRPAYTLIHYGTNDWNGSNCARVTACYTIPSLRQMIRDAKAAHSVPVVATLIPANPAANEARHRPADRNAWILETNAYIKQLVAEEGAVLADLHAEFDAQGEAAWPSLFSDHVHPNDGGYALMADGFFKAIVTARGAR